MSERDEDLERFERLLQRSSLGTPGARQLRERTPASYVEVARRIYQLRSRIAHSEGADNEAATIELAHFLADLGYLVQADRVLDELPPTSGTRETALPLLPFGTTPVPIPSSAVRRAPAQAGGVADEHGRTSQVAVQELPARAPLVGDGRRIVGAERQTLAKDLVKRYMAGESIRALAASTGRSYGFVHRVLTECGVQLRQRGGARRKKA